MDQLKRKPYRMTKTNWVFFAAAGVSAWLHISPSDSRTGDDVYARIVTELGHVFQAILTVGVVFVLTVVVIMVLSAISPTVDKSRGELEEAADDMLTNACLATQIVLYWLGPSVLVSPWA